MKKKNLRLLKFLTCSALPLISGNAFGGASGLIELIDIADSGNLSSTNKYVSQTRPTSSYYMQTFGGGSGSLHSSSSSVSLKYTGNSLIPVYDISGGPSIRAIDVNGKTGSVLQINNNVSVGSIVNNSGSQKLDIRFSGTPTLTLNGAPADTGNYGFNTSSNDYTALGSVDFAGTSSTLIVAVGGGGPVTLSNTFLNAGNATLRLNTTTTITDPSVGNMKTINLANDMTINTNGVQTAFSNAWTNTGAGGYVYFLSEATVVDTQSFWTGVLSPCSAYIGNSGTSTTLTLKPIAAADSNISFIYLENPNSTLVLDSTNAGGSIKFTANNASIYGRNSGTSVAEDLSGTIKKNAVTRSITIEGSKSLGYDSTHRLLSLQIAGDSSTTIDAIVYSADITVKNSAGTVTFKRGVDQGTNCTLNLERSASFAPTTPATWKLSGTTAIKTTHNGSDASGGQLILSGGSTVDLSGATTLTVEVKGSSTLPPSGTEYSYKLFDNSSGGAITAPSVSTTFTNSDSQSLIKWNYDPATYTLSSTTDTSGIVVAAAGGGGGGATIAAALVAADNTGNDVARRILSDIGLLSPERIGDSLRMLLTSDPTSTSASETFDVVGSTLNNRMGEFIAEGGVVELWGGTWELQEVRTEGLRGADAPPDVIQGGTGELQEVRTEGLQEGTGVQGGGLTPGDWGVSAGDDTTAVTKHGVWANYVYYAATQKTVGQNNGYKTINQGNTIGYDYMIGEGNTMGLAYSQFHSRFKESAFKSGNKGKTKTHSIHLYGIKDLFVRRHDLFITYNAGLGFGKVQNSQQRLITRNVTRFADSKYNSNIYSGSATLGKRINLRNKLMVIPTAGLSYNQFNDGGYSETGAGTQNLRVSKKTSYGLDGALGVSTRYSCLHSKTGITLEPSIFAKTFINLKDKAPIMYISSDAFLAPVRIDGTKKNSAWYQFGAGLNMKKNSWDCSFSYDVSLDKKYVGHQGAIKVRVNM